MSRGPLPRASGAWAVLLTLAIGLGGALADLLTGPGLRLGFAACFIGGCALSALLVRRRDLGVAVVMPPLVYVVIALVTGSAQGSSASGSFLVRQVLGLFTALVLQAPALLVATGLSLVVALARGLGRRPPVTAGRAFASSDR